MIVLSISDAAYGSQPEGGSQGGLLVGIASPLILEGPAPIVLLEGASSKLQRVVRCSMAAELSQAATAYEHVDYVRAVWAEIVMKDFELHAWKYWASKWRHFLVLDAKVAYDALQSDNTPTDRKLIVDIAVLRQALEKPGAGYIRWVPGREIPSDGLTKQYGNGVLERVLAAGSWSLCDTPEAATDPRFRLEPPAPSRYKRCGAGFF